MRVGWVGEGRGGEGRGEEGRVGEGRGGEGRGGEGRGGEGRGGEGRGGEGRGGEGRGGEGRGGEGRGGEGRGGEGRGGEGRGGEEQRDVLERPYTVGGGGLNKVWAVHCGQWTAQRARPNDRPSLKKPNKAPSGPSRRKSASSRLVFSSVAHARLTNTAPVSQWG